MNIFGLWLQESENCKAEILKLELEDLENTPNCAVQKLEPVINMKETFYNKIITIVSGNAFGKKLKL